MIYMNNIIIENKKFKLCINDNCVAQSLIFKESGEECLDNVEGLALFSLTEERPYNNEIKLAHPNKKTTFPANRIRREGNRLIIGFELITFEAIVEVNEKDDYITFKLVDFIIYPHSFGSLCMTPPPVFEFRLIQLPIRERENFGEWLNVCFDESLAVNVLGLSPHPRIDSEMRMNSRVLTADAVRGVKLRGCEVALIVSKTEKYLDVVEQIEEDYNLPKGVAARRNPRLNSSVYWVGNLNPQTVDEHIEHAKRGGFRNMLVYYSAMVYEDEIYALCGNYDFRREVYPNGYEDVKAVLKKIKDAGITPGLHFLHTHIGKRSRYVTPVADHRLSLTRHFTLAKPLGFNDTTVFVEENPEDSVMHEKCRVLKFGGELIHYESFTTEPPYRFEGCVRGHWDTNITEHELGQIGGLLDISEFSAVSVYVNQNSSLQDEIADKIAALYNCGFEFVYMDGSEGANPPFEYHVPNAQYRVYKKFNHEPLFVEGAAKGHFSWHMMSGGNAFDIFPAETFKAMAAKHPLQEAPMMAKNFTRVDFGWWRYFPDAQPDLYEYSTSKAASWDCPVTLQARNDLFVKNPRNADVFEVIRRWEDVRAKRWLTDEQKQMLRDPDTEYILLINEKDEYELVPYFEVKNPDEQIKAFVFERLGKSYAVCWHKTDTVKILLPINAEFTYETELGKEKLPVYKRSDGTVIEISDRRYLSAYIDLEEMKVALKNAIFIG